MSVSQKLKWKKIVNQLRYMYEEMDIIDDMSSAAAPEFQEYYEQFCAQQGMDIGDLNRKHAERVGELYRDTKGGGPPPSSIPYTGSTGLVPFEGEEAPQIDTPPSEVGLDGDDKQMHDIFCKLFKKLAIQLHPDKLSNTDLAEEEKKEMLQMFTKAKAALEEKRYFVLIDYAEKLKIPLPKNYNQQTRWMKKELEAARSKIGTQMRSYNYLFAEADTDGVRDDLIKQFIHQLFGEKV